MLILGYSAKKLFVLRLRLFLHVVHLLKEKVIERVIKSKSTRDRFFFFTGHAEEKMARTVKDGKTPIR